MINKRHELIKRYFKRKMEYLLKNGRVTCKSIEIVRGVIDMAAAVVIYVEGHKVGGYVGLDYWELRICKGA